MLMPLDDYPDEETAGDHPCPVCGQRMYAVQVEQGIYALPCFHWLYQGRGEEQSRGEEPPHA